MSRGSATVQGAIVVAGITGLAGLCLRLICISDPWDLDESSTLIRFVDRAPQGLWRNYDENNHLLASALAALLQTIGLSGQVTLRQVAVVPSVMAVTAVAYWCARRRGWPGGLLAGAVLASTPIRLLEVDRLRGYGLALLGVTLTVLALAELRECARHERWLWWTAVGGAVLAVASWPLSVLPLAAAFLVSVLQLRRLPPIVPVGVGVVVLAVWWFPVAGQLFATVRANGRRPPYPGRTATPFRYLEAATGATTQAGVDAGSGRPGWVLLLSCLLVGVVAVLGVTCAWRLKWIPALNEVGRRVLAELVVLLAMTAALVGFVAPRGLMADRFAQVLVPALALVLAGLVPNRRWAGVAVGIAMVPVVAFGAVEIGHRAPPPYEAIVSAAEGSEQLFVLTPDRMPGFQTATEAVPGSPRLRVVLNEQAEAIRQVLPDATVQMRISPTGFFDEWCAPNTDVALVQRVLPRHAHLLIERLEKACGDKVRVRRHRIGAWLVLASR